MNRLKLMRLEIQLSQIELSLASNVPRHVIQLAEQGIRLPTTEQQAALAKTLGVKTKTIFQEQGEASEK